MELAENARKRNNHHVTLDNFEEDPEILRMAAQVTDVLPYVPQNVIVANLSMPTNKPFYLYKLSFKSYYQDLNLCICSSTMPSHYIVS